MNYWSQFPQAECLPDGCNCELIRSGWICQPSAFWSSLVYFAVAWYLYRSVKVKTQLLKIWTVVIVGLGIFSMLGHGTFLKLALSMDFAGIVVIISFFSVLKLFKKSPILWFLLYFNLLWMSFYSLTLWVKIALCVVIFVLSVSDIIHSLQGEFKKSRTLHIALYILVGSFALFLVDESRLICAPESWLQGHSIWHAGSALAIYYYGKWRFLEREPFYKSHALL